MMRNSTNGRGFRRLNQSERLIASSVTQALKGKKGKRADQMKENPFEFAFLNCSVREDSGDDEEDDNLRREMIVERGIVTLGEQDSERTIREKLVTPLKKIEKRHH